LRDSEIDIIEEAPLSRHNSADINKDTVIPVIREKKSLEITVVDEKPQAQVAAKAIDEKKSPEVTVKEIDEKKDGTSGIKPPIAPSKQRVDYLAGLVRNPLPSVSSLTNS